MSYSNMHACMRYRKGICEYATLQILWCSGNFVGKVSIKRYVLYAKICNNFLVNVMVIALQGFCWIGFIIKSSCTLNILLLIKCICWRYFPRHFNVNIVVQRLRLFESGYLPVEIQIKENLGDVKLMEILVNP